MMNFKLTLGLSHQAIELSFRCNRGDVVMTTKKKHFMVADPQQSRCAGTDNMMRRSVMPHGD